MRQLFKLNRVIGLEELEARNVLSTISLDVLGFGVSVPLSASSALEPAARTMQILMAPTPAVVLPLPTPGALRAGHRIVPPTAPPAPDLDNTPVNPGPIAAPAPSPSAGSVFAQAQPPAETAASLNSSAFLAAQTLVIQARVDPVAESGALVASTAASPAPATSVLLPVSAIPTTTQGHADSDVAADDATIPDDWIQSLMGQDQGGAEEDGNVPDTGVAPFAMSFDQAEPSLSIGLPALVALANSDEALAAGQGEAVVKADLGRLEELAQAAALLSLFAAPGACLPTKQNVPQGRSSVRRAMLSGEK